MASHIDFSFTADYMPAPDDVEAIKGTSLDGETSMERISSDDEPFSALAFKIMTDPFVGTLTFCRIYSGILNAGDGVYNSVKGQRERVGRMLQMLSLIHNSEPTRPY